MNENPKNTTDDAPSQNAPKLSKRQQKRKDLLTATYAANISRSAIRRHIEDEVERAKSESSATKGDPTAALLAHRKFFTARGVTLDPRGYPEMPIITTEQFDVVDLESDAYRMANDFIHTLDDRIIHGAGPGDDRGLARLWEDFWESRRSYLPLVVGFDPARDELSIGDPLRNGVQFRVEWQHRDALLKALKTQQPGLFDLWLASKLEEV